MNQIKKILKEELSRREQLCAKIKDECKELLATPLNNTYEASVYAGSNVDEFVDILVEAGYPLAMVIECMREVLSETEVIWALRIDNTSSFKDVAFSNLKRIESTLYAWNTKISGLEKLEHVGYALVLDNTKVTAMPNLKYVGQYLSIEGLTELRSLPELEYVGDKFEASYCGIKSRKQLPKLKYKNKIKY